MNVPAIDNKEQLLRELAQILDQVIHLREAVGVDADSLQVINEAALVRSSLDELEKLVFERYSRECFVSSLNQDDDELGDLLVVLQRMFK